MQGGVGAFTHELATALVGLGHEVHVITRADCGLGQARRTEDESPAASGLPLAANLSIHPVVPHWGWRSFGQIMNLADRLHIDVLNIQYQTAAFDMHPAINFFPFFASHWVGWRTRPGFCSKLRNGRPKPVPQAQHEHIPSIATFHDLRVPYLFPKAGPLRDWAVTSLAKHADATIVTNLADELALIARNVTRVERIPIGSNITPTLPKDYDAVAWRAQLDIGPEGLLLGFFGFFNARKGVETLIRAVAALDTSYHLLFIGGTVGSSDLTSRAYADRMLTLIADLGLGERVHFTGYVSEAEVSAAFGALDLCVLPYADGISFHHGTLMAALAHRQAIVSTQPPIEVPELVHDENVWLVRPEDPKAIVTAITTLAANPAQRRHLARGAAELSAGLTWERIAKRTAEVFDSVKRGA